MKYLSFALVLIGLLVIPSCYFDEDIPYNNDRYVDGIMDNEYFNSFNASATYYPDYYQNNIYYPGELILDIPLYFNGRFYGEYLTPNSDTERPGFFMPLFTKSYVTSKNSRMQPSSLTLRQKSKIFPGDCHVNTCFWNLSWGLGIQL